mmetsp:Transcript_12481/g.26361  ORF Transcript_12481/g.26361 Transcript_12481/m.26361 type:complete len:429 (+) Transcript_12481:18-1304(+)|eukprot:CAMPEP_0171421778 /NCGR_PEP_ID=MMETSP0881-20121228/796_1 /TAXON_ID=67004 /ORGANISM="Thalassiosira weissflogii, Strain CCMP1336" /LENGTH=428 /DNA_ID=CAMNT_0011940237 /DNA_START=1 /DNA_END=1287 /DNA_ORIENTATION=+
MAAAPKSKGKVPTQLQKISSQYNGGFKKTAILFALAILLVAIVGQIYSSINLGGSSARLPPEQDDSTEFYRWRVTELTRQIEEKDEIISRLKGSSGVNESGATINAIDFDKPPEALDTIEFCAEKCRYLPKMCSSNLHRDKLALPAPLCLNYSLTVADDIYWSGDPAEVKRRVSKRNAETVTLISWAAAKVREGKSDFVNSHGGKVNCEDVPTEHTGPMMFPEEFQFIVKLMANLKPVSYLEWGCGKSTSFYPLLASETVYAIDGYPPWCEKVEEEPRVKCMVEEGKLKFLCKDLLGANGNPLNLLPTGRLSRNSTDEDVEAAMSMYVNAIDDTAASSLDLALVDGRFRVQCAIKLLPFLKEDSVLLMHDFWIRKAYHPIVFEYYYVIGYARSVVALKKKHLGLSKQVESQVHQKYMKRIYASPDEFL